MAKKSVYKRKNRQKKRQKSKKKRRKSSKKRRKSRKKRRKCQYNRLQPILHIKANQCKGKITPKGIIEYKNTQILQFNSLYCLIAKYQLVAWIPFSDSNIEYYRQHSNIINKIIDLANECGVYAIINSFKQNRHLLAFYKKNLPNALLILYLSTTQRGNDLKTHYLIEKLLGYTEKNMRAFYKRINKYYEYKRDKNINKKLIKLIKNGDDYDNFIAIQKSKIMKIPNIR